jgi:hypothetical protein
MRNSLALIAVALFIQGAHAIIRIGNNDQVPGRSGELGDSVEGFYAAVPDTFDSVDSEPDHSAVLHSTEPVQSPGTEGDSGDGPPPDLTYVTMVAYRFEAIYPKLVKASEAQLIAMLTKKNFNVQEVSHTNCAFFLLGESDTSYQAIAKWGTHGYVLTVDKSPSDGGRDGIMTILNSTKITNACSP